MDYLIEAAKAVISAEFVSDQRRTIKNLQKAIERAESDDEEDRINEEAMNIHFSGVMAERKRIKKIILEVTGGFGNHDRLIEKIDE